MSLFEESVNSKLNILSLSEKQVFWKYHELENSYIPDKKYQKELEKFIFEKKSIQGDFILITYYVKPPKRETDDEIYNKNFKLVQLLPRAMTLIFNKQGNFLCILSGPSKFSGAENLDEDDAEDGSIFSIYDSAKTIKWSSQNNCHITKLTKANGKFAICKLFKYGGKLTISFGSKNSHHCCYVNDLESFLESQDITYIVKSIGEDILKNISNLVNLLPSFNQGFSLVGELEDGMHFVPGDNTVSWFGLFKNGIPQESEMTLKFLTSNNIKTVSYQVVFEPGDSIEKLKEVFTMSRCDGGEGSVLYIRNIKTGETQLAKSKSAIYKLKRMFRQRWLASPITIYQKLIQRIVETADYHLLNTQTAIEIAKKLFQFGLWLVENNFPCGILDFQPVKSVRGEIPAGFSVYWEKFIKDTGIEDISLNPDNFGDFDKDIFSNSEELKVFSKNSNTNKPIVIFFQDIQGGGKSTIAHKLERIDVIEQDICYGCTKTTQFKLLQKIKSGKNVIVSRCNVNSKQYDAYLKIAFDNDCRILFLSTENADSELRLSVALAGVINRSSKGDNVMVGRLEYPFDEVVKFTTANWTSFKYHPKVIKIKTFRMDQKLRIEAENAYKNNSIKTFVENKKDILMSLREPLNKIVFEIQNIVDNPPKESFIRKGLEDTSYISFNLLDNSKLIEFVKEHCNIQGKTLYCQHITQVFLGKKTKTTIEVSESGESCIVETDALVINKKNGSAAFRVVNLQSSEGKMIFVESGVPHITALVSADSKPVDSVKFVKKTDDSVEVIPFNNTFETICVWN